LPSSIGIATKTTDVSPIRAVLFDLDGTLVDSAEDLKEAVNRLLGQRGLRAVTRDEVTTMIGDGALKLVERALAATESDPALAPELLPRFLELYEGNAAMHTRAFPGAQEVLLTLKQRRISLGLVTNKPAAATAEILKALGLAPFFGAVVGGDTLPERKPSPAPLFHAARQLRVRPPETLMVGDNHHDVRAARAAGMRVAAVTYGYCHVPHEELSADWLIDSLSELPRLVGP
jgi:phosphoglycolate phosphatase